LKFKINYFFYFFSCLVIIPFIFHFIYSSYGFNPTDDGLFLSASKRIINGEIPHLDFISVRPAGSALLHIIEVLYAGDHLYYITRLLVWFQFSAISFFWMEIIKKVCLLKSKYFFDIIVITISIMFCSHTFPIMSNPTIDGIFFCSLGIYFITYNNYKLKTLGYFLLGCSLLFKQSFLFVPFLVLLIFDDYKNLKFIFVTSIASIIYLLALVSLGAVSDFMIQISSVDASIVQIGIISFFTNKYIYLGIFIAVLLSIFKNTNKISYNTKLVLLYFFTIIISMALYQIEQKIGSSGIFWIVSFILLGISMGLLIIDLMLSSNFQKNTIKIMLLVYIISWSVTLSKGYSTPALFSGVLFISVVSFLGASYPLASNNKEKIFTFILLILFIGIYDYSRKNYVYRDRPSKELTFKLNNILPGGNNILTNKDTFLVIKEIKTLTKKYNNEKIAIIPDYPGYWAASEINNPLPADWLQKVEVPNGAPYNKLTESINNIASSGIIIMQKYSMHNLNKGLDLIQESNYHPIISFVKQNVEKIDESEYYEIYSNKY